MSKKTKQTGKTEVYPFWNMEDIKKMMDYFKTKKMWHWYLAFNFGLLLGRRVSDTLSLKWSDFYYKNGRMKDETDIKEWKTGKIVRLYICEACKDALKLYIEQTGVDPMENYNDFINGTAKMSQLLEDEEEYTEEEYKELMMKAVQSHAAAFRKQFKIAADACNIQYAVSTHSLRKNFGYWSVKLHPYDVTTVDKLQGIFSHSDRNTTLHYIGIAREDEKKLYSDMGNFITDISNGKKPIIKNSPVLTIKTEDARELFSKCFDMAKDGAEKFEVINRIIGLAEKRMV